MQEFFNFEKKNYLIFNLKFSPFNTLKIATFTVFKIIKGTFLESFRSLNIKNEGEDRFLVIF